MRGAVLLVWALGSACAAGGGGVGLRHQALVSPRPGGFAVDVLTAVVTTAGVAAVGLLLDRQKEDWAGRSPCPARPADPDAVCDAAGVPALDRPVTRLGWRPARPMSDAALLAMVGLPYAVSAADTGFNRLEPENVAVDSLVISQTLAATMLSVALLKVMVLRARPFTYNAEFTAEERRTGDARLSFPSGHAAISFAAASVTSVMLLRRTSGPAGALGAVGAYLGASGVATLRVLAGKHFITDVLVGAALGTAIGLALPLAHARDGATVGQTAGAALGQDRAVLPVLTFGGAF